MRKVLFYPKGSIITFTSGEYSDFGIAAYLVTIRDCDLPALAKIFDTEKRAGEPRRPYNDGTDDFPTWLVTKQYAVPVDTSEVWLGAYNTWNPELVTT